MSELKIKQLSNDLYELTVFANETTSHKVTVTDESPAEQYVHPNEKRTNNPPVGMVDPNNDPDQPSKRYSYDPRLDPQLQWSGKTENSEFDVDTVSLHVHERIDTLTIIEKAMNAAKGPSLISCFLISK